MKTYVFPFSETNSLPSLCTVSNPDNGVRSQLSTTRQTPDEFNGLSIEDLRGLHGVHGLDKMDTLAVASQKLADSAGTYKKSQLHTAFSQRVTSNRKK